MVVYIDFILKICKVCFAHMSEIDFYVELVVVVESVFLVGKSVLDRMDNSGV